MHTFCTPKYHPWLQDGTKGTRCAGPKTSKPFTCSGIYSTTKCIAGYDCENNTCTLQGPGQGVDKDACEAQCDQGCGGDISECCLSDLSIFALF